MVIERNILLSQLRELKENDFALEEENDAAVYLHSLLYYIGDADAELRDDLIYECFATWIEERDYFQDEELKALFIELSSEAFLLKKDTEAGPSTLTRSFSALVLTAILNKNLREPILADEEINRVAAQACQVFSLERDFRSFDPKEGWVHALAHYADLMGALLKQEGIDNGYLKDVLQAFEIQLELGDSVFTGQEEERFISAVYDSVFTKDLLKEEDVLAWINQLKWLSPEQEPTRAMRSRINRKQTLRALYFRGLKRQLKEPYLNALIEAEAEVSRFK